MSSPPQPHHPYAVAMEWVAKITTVGLEMILPAVGGRYLDLRWDTNYWVLIGLAFGGTVGFWHLLKMTRPRRSQQLPGEQKDSASGSAKR